MSEIRSYLRDTERQSGLWGEEGQKRLGRATVAIGGLGGIGAVSALMLAKAGVGRIRVCDRDDYEVANIVEQAFATYETVGCSKVETALSEMGKHTRFSRLEGFVGDLSRKADCERLMEEADVVISGVDNARARIALGRAADLMGLPFVVSANIGWSAVHTVYLPGEMSYRAVWRDVPAIRLQGGYPDMSDPDTLLSVEREWKIWTVAVSGFQREALRSFLAGDQSYYWYSSPPAYFTASLGVMDALKILVGNGVPTIYPQMFFFDMKRNRAWKWEELRHRHDKLRAVWDRGPGAIWQALKELNGEL